MDKIIFCLLLSGGVFCLIGVITYGIVTVYRKRKYGRISSTVFFNRYSEKIYKFFSRSDFFIKLNNEIAYKISVFNSMSFEKNRKISVFILLGFAFFTAVSSVALVVMFMPYWYIALVYIIVINMALLFGLQLISDVIMNRYLKKLPEAIKILQARFMSKGSISKAIHVSLPDLPKGIKEEMVRIYDAMKHNETEKTKDVFREIDTKYANEHMSVLLDLIWLAHYNGGTDTVKAQFDAMVRDIIEDLENQHDLTGAAISYIAMSVLFMIAIPLVRVYNRSILGQSEMQYYTTRDGMLFAAAYIVFLVLLIGGLFYLKKKG